MVAVVIPEPLDFRLLPDNENAFKVVLLIVGYGRKKNSLGARNYCDSCVACSGVCY